MLGVWIITVYFILTSAVSLFLALKASSRNLVLSARPFALLVLCMVLYLVAGAMHILRRDIGWMLFWNNVIYLGMVWIGPLWLVVALTYARGGRGLPRPFVLALLVLPVITLLLKYTNRFHRLVYESIGINRNDLVWTLSFERGPWYWVHVVSTGMLILAGSLILVGVFFRTSGRFRNQAILMAIGGLFPWGALVLYLSGRFFWGLDIIPFVFFATILLFLVGLLRHGLFEDAPVSWRSIAESMNSGIVVLDSGGRILEMNAMIPTLAGTPYRRALKDWSGLVKRLPPLSALDPFRDSARLTFPAEPADTGRIIQVHVSLMTGLDGEPFGSTVIFSVRNRPELPPADTETERDVRRLVRGMDNGKWYLDPDLTLDTLARRTGLPRNRVSYLLNNRFRMPARDFINSYRVREAITLLESQPVTTILDICFSAGFNSKATFYTAFKKHTGKAPGDYPGGNGSKPEADTEAGAEAVRPVDDDQIAE